MFKINKLHGIVNFFLCMSPLVMSGAYAGEINDLVNHETAHRDQILQETYGQFTPIENVAQQKVQTYQSLVNSIKNSQNQNEQQALIKEPPRALIFVSFSIPNSNLQQIIQDGARYQIPVVMRGLCHNSFQETASKLFDLVKGNNKGGVMIDPLWFRKFNIDSVPALVVTDGVRYDVVYGNLPLKGALKIVEDKGALSNIATQILKEQDDD